MAGETGTVRIQVDASQAQQSVDRLSKSLQGLDSQVKGLQTALAAANATLSRTGTATAGSAQQFSKLVHQVQTSTRQISGMQNQITILHSQMQAMQSVLAQLRMAHMQAASGANTQAQASQELSTSMQHTSSAATSLNGVLVTLGLSIGLQQAIEILKDFDHAMAQVEAISGATGMALDGLREKAKELGATTIYTSSEAAKGMKYLAQSGFNVNEIMEASGPVLALAQAGDIGLAQAAEIAAKALRGFRLEATEMSDVADVMAAAVTQSTMNIQEMGYAFKYVAPIAASMGVNIREASAYIGVLSDAGIDATMAGTALRRIMSELSNPTIKATKLLAAHGLTLNDVDIKARGLTATIKTLVEAGLTVGEVFALFGDRGAPAFQTLAQQIEKVEEKTSNLQNVTGRAQKMQETMNQSLFASYKNLTSAIEFLVIQFAEESGALEGLKTVFFSAAEAIRTLARNMDTLAPLFAALATVSISKVVAGLLSLVTGNKQATSSFVLLGRTIGTQMALAKTSVAAASGAMNTLKVASAGAATVIGTGLRGAVAAVATAFGGWNLAIMAAVGGLTYFLMQESPTKSFAEKFDDLLQANRKSALEYSRALEVLQKKINEMTATRAGEALRELQNRFADMQKEMDSFVSKLNDVNFVYQNMGNLWGEGAELASEQSTEHYAAVKKLWAEYKNGEKNIGDVKNALEGMYQEVATSDPQLAQQIARMQQTVEAMVVAQDAADKYRVRLAILTGTVNQLDARLQGLANTLQNIGLLTGEQLNKLSSDLSMSEWKNYIYTMGEMLGMNKQQFKEYKNGMEYIGKLLTEEERQLLNFNWTKEGGLRVALKDLDQLSDTQQLALQRLRGTSEESIKAFDGQITKMNEVLSSGERLAGQVKTRTELDKKETDSLKKKGGAGTKFANALIKVNEELARMTMTDREFQQMKFEQELAKLEKTVGRSNPKFQELIKLWEKAKELGMSSPKELINARTSFEDFVKAKEHGGDKGWAQKEAIEAQARMLEEMYKNDASKQIYIAQWVADQKNQINAKGLNKDTQTLLKFWDDYLNISAMNENKYSELLNKYYEERYAAYKQLCDDEVAARAMAEYDKLSKTRDALSGIKKGTADWVIENSNMAKQTADIMKNFYDGVADAMTDMVISGKANWEDLGKTVIKQFTQMIIKAMILANLMKLMGMLSDAVGGWFSGGTSYGDAGMSRVGATLPNLPGAGSGAGMAMAKGGVFAGGSISDFSSTVINTPTMFDYDKQMTQFARGGAVMGEAGWEGILPLTKNSRGELGVKADSVGASVMQPVVVNVINNSGAEATTQENVDSNGNKSIDVIIGDMMATQMQRPGSNLNKAVRNVTGVKQQVIRR